jgi:hypothetical protein
MNFIRVFLTFNLFFLGRIQNSGFIFLNWKICRRWGPPGSEARCRVWIASSGRRCPNTVRLGIKGAGVLTTSTLSHQAERSAAAGPTPCAAGAHPPRRVKPPVFASELIAGAGAVAARAHRVPRKRRVRALPPPSLRWVSRLRLAASTLLHRPPPHRFPLLCRSCRAAWSWAEHRRSPSRGRPKRARRRHHSVTGTSHSRAIPLRRYPPPRVAAPEPQRRAQPKLAAIHARHRSALCTSPQARQSSSCNSRAACPHYRWARTPLLPSWPSDTVYVLADAGAPSSSRGYPSSYVPERRTTSADGRDCCAGETLLLFLSFVAIVMHDAMAFAQVQWWRDQLPFLICTCAFSIFGNS